MGLIHYAPTATSCSTALLHRLVILETTNYLDFKDLINLVALFALWELKNLTFFLASGKIV